MEDPIPDMPVKESPISPILDWYNIARKRANAPNLQFEAHWLDVSLPKLRNIIDTNKFDNTQIKLLDKHSIDLNIAACISQMPEHWDIILTDEYLSDLRKSKRRLSVLWFERKGDSVDTDDMMMIFRKENYCGMVYQARLNKIGRTTKRSFEKMLQDILRKIARGQNTSQKQNNVVFQAINQERDSEAFNWTSASLKKNCPLSVELVENWDGI